MACYNNPQGFDRVPVNSLDNSYYTTPVNQLPAQTTAPSYYGSSNFNTPMDYTAQSTPAMDTTGNDTYLQQGQWGEIIPVNPNDPTSPLSVQPNGSGTPFTVTDPAPLPETITQSIYIPGYLNQYIGRMMRVEFLVGSQTTDRVGYLREVGASYIVLESVDYGNLMMCDLYSIKFATILRAPLEQQIATLYEDQ